MKNPMLRTLSLALVVLCSLVSVVGCRDRSATETASTDSSREVTHSESDKTGWFGGQVHKANTTYKNSDGSSSIETETTSTKGNTTTIERERKTTTTDGKVTTDRETRTIVKGSDSTVHE